MGSNMDFYQRLALAGEMIPEGKVASYGQLALLCGCPRNARQVGYALNHNKAGGNFPAHRVVNSSGALTGAAAFDTIDVQRLLLEKESVKVVGQKVDLLKYGWHPSLEDAIWLREKFGERGI